jgi:3-oxoacyl-[acyl-carrier protein] reductase
MPTALVTGCLGAIGGAICGELAQAGYDLIGVDIGDGAGFAPGAYEACDLADAPAVEALLARVHAGGRPVDLLVNNAGYYRPKPFFETTAEEFDRYMAINARALFQLCQGVARRMVEDGRGGAIVNIASIAGKLGSPIVPYGTSKAAVIGLTKSLSKVLAPHGIRVNAVAPGMIVSPMTRAIAEPQMEAQLGVTAMGRLGQPEEIARVVAFLASPAASYMNGSIVDVAGGWMS